MKLTKKDQKILRELYDNARKPYSEIAKQVGISKEAVAYRIKRMQEGSLLTGFNTVIDIEKLGWKMFFVYLKLQFISLETEDEIFATLQNNKHVAQLSKTIGNYDILIKLFAKDFEAASDIVKEIESKLHPHINKYVIDYVTKDNPIPKTLLFPQEKRLPEPYIEYGTRTQIKTSDTDRSILHLISNNARISLTDIATKLGISRELAKYHLTKLEKQKVILKYRPEIWTGLQEKGWNLYFVMLEVGQMSPELEKQFQTFITQHLNVNFLYKTVGISDIRLEIQTHSTIEFSKILLEIRSLLKSVLKRYELVMILDEKKFTYWPACMDEK